jgi:hypothetical protein
MAMLVHKPRRSQREPAPGQLACQGEKAEQADSPEFNQRRHNAEPAPSEDWENHDGRIEHRPGGSCRLMHSVLGRKKLSNKAKPNFPRANDFPRIGSALLRWVIHWTKISLKSHSMSFRGETG